MPMYPPSLCSGCYCLARTVCIIPQENGGLALCSYPLRVLRLSTLTTRLLLCREQRTCKDLAQVFDLPTRRVQTLCEQLRWKGLLEAGPTLPPVTWPGVSIIIPSYNRANQLERCIKSLIGQDYPTQYLELIVVNDASTDETATMLQNLAQNESLQYSFSQPFYSPSLAHPHAGEKCNSKTFRSTHSSFISPDIVMSASPHPQRVACRRFLVCASRQSTRQLPLCPYRGCPGAAKSW